MEIQGTGSGELFGHSSGIESLSTSSDTWAVGSLGLVTYDDFILTAAHVAAYDSGTGTFYGIGKPVYQGGEKIGELSAYIPVAPNTVNYADAALISMTSEVPRSPGTVFGEFGNYQIAGWTTVAVGDSVKKSGPMTNLTWGSVTHTNEQVPTDFGAYEVIFYDHIEVRLSNAYFAVFGDSGSAVSRDGQFVGLVVAMGMEYHWFWGYATASFGYVTKAEHIIDGLGISLQPSTGGGGGGGPGFPPPLELLVERSSPS
ncbi:MAG: hypothetical protein IBX67_08200 [Dehalococcoidia bacterium]|nr:hypothetical protein [Dehalococcoidia bacterium]